MEEKKNCMVRSYLFDSRWVVIIFIGLSGLCPGQTADTIQYNPILIEATRLKNVDASVLIFDSTALTDLSPAHLGSKLAYQSIHYMRTSGLNGLSTFQTQGGNTNHTRIIWQGYDISSPMNGTMDLSLLPMNAFDEVSLLDDGLNPLNWKNALSQSISLITSLPHRFRKKCQYKIGVSYGAFDQLQAHGQLAIKKEGHLLGIRLFGQKSDNDYFYQHPDSHEKEQMPKKYTALIGSTIDYTRSWQNSVFSLNAWTQSAKRSLLPSIYVSDHNEVQYDDHIRLHTSLTLALGQGTIRTKIAGFFDDNQYKSDLIASSHNNTQRWLSDVTYSQQFQSIYVETGGKRPQ